MKKLYLLSALTMIILLSVSFFSFAKDIETKHKELIQSLSNNNMDVRTKAAQKLGEDKVLAAVKPLTNMLTNDKVYNARIAAALALFNIGDKQVLPLLKERSQTDENKTVRTVLDGIIKKMEANS